MTKIKNNPVINGYTFSNQVMNLMKKNLIKTKNTGNEHGFNLCSREKDGDKILQGVGETKGSKGGIMLSNVCHNGDDYVGSYHTHPGGKRNYDTRQSFGDIDTTCNIKEKISCVGSVNKKGRGEVNCYFNNDYDKQKKDCKPGLPNEACSMVTDRCLDFEEDEGKATKKQIKEYTKTLDNIYDFVGKKTILEI